MLELAQMSMMMPTNTAIRITPVRNVASVRLKTWVLESESGVKPVVLAGRELPTQVGETSSGPMRVLCIGPGDWLVVSLDESTRSKICEQLGSDLERQGLAIVDLTDGLTRLAVQGSAAREALSTACGIDFHPRSFPVGRCARTRFAHIPVVIDCLDQPSRFELYVSRSYFQYFYSWLATAAAEFKDVST